MTRTINVTLEDAEFEQVQEAKGSMTWEEAIKEWAGVHE